MILPGKDEVMDLISAGATLPTLKNDKVFDKINEDENLK